MASRLKAALVSFPAGCGTPTVIVFQFNPETLTRSLPPPPTDLTVSTDVEQAISFTLALDAVDLDAPIDPTIQAFGVLPTLTALELLVQESRGAAPPHVLFVWGARILAVQPVSLLIRETEFNQQLAPVRAEVDLVLNVLDAQKQGAPAAVRHAWDENQAVRKRVLASLPRSLPDYISRILK